MTLRRREARRHASTLFASTFGIKESSTIGGRTPLYDGRKRLEEGRATLPSGLKRLRQTHHTTTYPAIFRQSMPYHARLRHITSDQLVSRHIKLRHVITRHSTS